MLNELLIRYPALAQCKADIKSAEDILISSYKSGGKVLICGNGGSSADGDHIVGELMKGFLKKRPLDDEKKAEMKSASPELTDEVLDKLQGALPAISLSSATALNSAFCNDVDPELVYAQCVLGLGRCGDVLIAISTSGNSKNAVNAALVAKALGLRVIALTGERESRLSKIADVAIKAPECETFKVQELHLPIYHYLCSAVEAYFFKA